MTGTLIEIEAQLVRVGDRLEFLITDMDVIVEEATMNWTTEEVTIVGHYVDEDGEWAGEFKTTDDYQTIFFAKR